MDVDGPFSGDRCGSGCDNGAGSTAGADVLTEVSMGRAGEG